MSDRLYRFMEAMGWFAVAWMAWAYHRRIEDLEAAVKALQPGDLPRDAQDDEGDYR